MSFGKSNARIYEGAGGKKAPSVTTILGLLHKEYLVPWATKEMVAHMERKLEGNSLVSAEEVKEWLQEARWAHRRKANVAAGIGTTVHKAVECYLRGDPIPPLCWQSEEAFNGFLKWFEENEIEPVEVEKKVFGNGYAGTLDFVCKIKGVPMLVDFKTSKECYDEYGMQLAAYREAYNNDPDKLVDIQGQCVVRLDKETGAVEVRDFTPNHEIDLEAFQCLVRFWELKVPCDNKVKSLNKKRAKK